MSTPDRHPSTAPLTAPGVTTRWITTPLGEYLLAATPEALIGVWRRDQTHFPKESSAPADAPSAPEDAAATEQRRRAQTLLDEASRQIQEYLTGSRTAFDLPLAPQGTPFRRAVWEELERIPRGGTRTYGEIARALGRPRAAQAVGAAVGANPLSIIVPCHRVVGSDGALTGYAGGIETKRTLLALEGALPS